MKTWVKIPGAHLEVERETPSLQIERINMIDHIIGKRQDDEFCALLVQLDGVKRKKSLLEILTSNKPQGEPYGESNG